MHATSPSIATDTPTNPISQPLSFPQVHPRLILQLAGKIPPKQPNSPRSIYISQKSHHDHQNFQHKMHPRDIALQQTRRIGDVLLKNEDVELKKLHKLAEDLLSREYTLPSGPPVCQKEADACLACYKEYGLHGNGGGDLGALRCRDAVAQYTECASKAW
jgi:hypothetical protein